MDEAATAYEGMRREADSTRDLYLHMQDKVEEAGLAVGVHDADIWVVDEARPPAKPVAPDMPLYLAITLFVGLWIAVGTALLLESLWPSAARVILGLLAVFATRRRGIRAGAHTEHAGDSDRGGEDPGHQG